MAIGTVPVNSDLSNTNLRISADTSQLTIEPDSPDDVIKPQRYEAETDLSVDSAHAIVLNPVEKKYQERHDT